MHNHSEGLWWRGRGYKTRTATAAAAACSVWEGGVKLTEGGRDAVDDVGVAEAGHRRLGTTRDRHDLSVPLGDVPKRGDALGGLAAVAETDHEVVLCTDPEVSMAPLRCVNKVCWLADGRKRDGHPAGDSTALA